MIKGKMFLSFRSNGKAIPYKYKFNLKNTDNLRINPVIDATNLIVISNEDYKRYCKNNKYKIDSSLYKYLLRKEHIVVSKYKNVIKDYINNKAIYKQTNLVKFSTIQYFHNELNLDNRIENKRKE